MALCLTSLTKPSFKDQAAQEQSDRWLPERLEEAGQGNLVP